MSVAVAAGAGPVSFNVEILCDDLVRQGWSVQALAGRELMMSALRDEVARRRADETLDPAGVGRAEDHQLVRALRRDHIHWLDGATPAQQAYLGFAEALRIDLNRRLMLGLWRYEAHFALYEAGGFYRKHRDAFRGARNRIVSTVLYLNDDWSAADGGLLRLYADDEETVIGDVVPALGTIAVFLSEEVPHEVLPAHRPRASIAGWFRCNDALETPVLTGTGMADRL